MTPEDRAAAQTGTRPFFLEPRVACERLPEGGLLLRSPVPLNEPPRCLGEYLAQWAVRTPARVAFAERDGTGGWRPLTYGAAQRGARAIGQALLDRGLGPERPLLILAENSIEHALMMLGALQAGVPVAPVSIAYARLSQDFRKLRTIADLTAPGLLYVSDGARYGAALGALDLTSIEIIAGANPPRYRGVTEFADLLATEPGAGIDRAYSAIGPDTVAKILFTSGSTGEPKGVINTHRMLCANQEALAQIWPFLTARPPVLVDWLPWNHTFGGNHDINLVLRNGGTLYIDEGKPLPGLIERTAANLREVAPTIALNVPRGYALLLDHLERDRDLARNFFSELDLIMYAAAALPQTLWERLERLSLRERGRKLPMASAWGATETAPMATAVHYPIARAGNVGIPAPGTEVKLVPSGDRLEIRVRGPHVTPGYWKRPDLTRAAFDAEGFYCPGDAMRLEDPDDPARGLIFDGRIAENFKLSTGNWVSVGALRVAAIAAAAPVIEDCVITGADRDEIGLLVFPSLAGCRGLCPGLGDAPLGALIGESAVRAALRRGLERLNAEAQGSSTRVARALLMDQPPSIDKGEITDKGYLNQRACLAHRAALVERLYAEPADPEVVRAG